MLLLRFQFQINVDDSEEFQYYFGAAVNEIQAFNFPKGSILSSNIILQVETPFQNKLNVWDVGWKSNEKKTKE